MHKQDTTDEDYRDGGEKIARRLSKNASFRVDYQAPPIALIT
jgi:hypothetical protein